ncbi:MAG: amino acid racemase [Spirochaetales bacterium]|nr:MAG: amino acid racemase [Spirochaetales bacterium]
MATQTRDTGHNGAIGVLGGMGPLATAEFFKKLTLAISENGGAAGDAQHPRVIVDSDPSIPDRTAYVLGKGPDPLPAMTAAAKRLVQAGATVCVLASITAHAYLDGLRTAVPCEFASAFDSLKARIERDYVGVGRVGVLATTGTIKSGLFDRYLPNLRVHYSDDEAQERFVMEAVYGSNGIKAGNVSEEPRHLLRQAAARLVARGAELIIVACAEMSLVLSPADVEVPLVDPMQFLVEDLATRFRIA